MACCYQPTCSSGSNLQISPNILKDMATRGGVGVCVCVCVSVCQCVCTFVLVHDTHLTHLPLLSFAEIPDILNCLACGGYSSRVVGMGRNLGQKGVNRSLD